MSCRSLSSVKGASKTICHLIVWRESGERLYSTQLSTSQCEISSVVNGTPNVITQTGKKVEETK
jgi:hypothetical protein